jgi:hypothetical protein
MSTRVGTLQAPRAGGSILLAAFLASVVMLTVAVVAISVDLDEGRQGETTIVGRQVVSTPSELSAGIVGGAEQAFVGGSAANTPTELSGGIRHKYVGGALGTDTPSELSGGLGNGIPAQIYDRHQRG